MAEPHERLAALFQGRTDAWGMVEGGCVRMPLKSSSWRSHVYGVDSVGVYPLLDDGAVHWGCIDVDDGYEQSLPVAANLHRCLRHLGVTSWVERTKGKGYHVWVLCSEWVPAVQMRAALLAVCQVIEYRPKEINPKQVTLQPGQLGNYVNVPYAKQWADVGKRVVLDIDGDREPIGLLTFLAAAEKHLNSPAVIAAAARLYKEPVRALAKIEEYSGELGPLVGRLRRLARVLFTDGPLPSQSTGRVDRSSALQRFAHLLAEDGFSSGEARALVEAFDQKLEKYTGRPEADRNRQYEKIVEKAFG